MKVLLNTYTETETSNLVPYGSTTVREFLLEPAGCIIVQVEPGDLEADVPINAATVQEWFHALSREERHRLFPNFREYGIVRVEAVSRHHWLPGGLSKHVFELFPR